MRLLPFSAYLLVPTHLMVPRHCGLLLVHGEEGEEGETQTQFSFSRRGGSTPLNQAGSLLLLLLQLLRLRLLLRSGSLPCLPSSPINAACFV